MYLATIVIIALNFIVAECITPRSGFFILHLTDHEDGTVLVKWSSSTDAGKGSGSCEVMSENYLSENMGTMENMTLKTPTQEEINTFLDICPNLPKTDHSISSLPSSGEESNGKGDSITVEMGNIVVFSFPGTKWCGPGNVSSSYDDLGFFADADKCCRAHDHCDDYMEVHETKHYLFNNSSYVKLNCECDNEFYKCLKKVNSGTAKTILYMFFKLSNSLCYALDYPITDKCIKYRTIFRIKCTKWEKDTNAPKIYKWMTRKQYVEINSKGNDEE